MQPSRESEMLPFNEHLFEKFRKAYNESQVKSSEYWQGYVDMILDEIKTNKLDGFGTAPQLTRGFGDAMSWPARPRVRALLKVPFLYRAVEKYLTNRSWKKSSNNSFTNAQGFFSQKLFIENLSREIAPVTRELGINRFNKVNGRDIPWRYMQAIAYIELLSSGLDGATELSPVELFDGNTMDIGGGYAPFVDALSIFKSTTNVGKNSTNYLLDQFPVCYIGHQYLTYRHSSNVLPPVLSAEDLTSTYSVGIGQSYRVIQNTSAKDIKGLNIKFFFNSASFQEMTIEQVRDYVEVIRNNCSETSYLACFFYPSAKSRNSPDGYVQLFESEFEAVGRKDLNLDGFVKGTLHLFRVM